MQTTRNALADIALGKHMPTNTKIVSDKHTPWVDVDTKSNDDDVGSSSGELLAGASDVQTVEDGRAVAKMLGARFIVIPFLRVSGEKFEIIGAMFSTDSGVTVRIGSFSFGRDIPSVLAQADVFSQSIEGSVKSFPYQNALVSGFMMKPSSRLTGMNSAALSARPAPINRSKTRWYKTWWFWTASAVVVGGLSSAGYFLLDGDDDSGKFELEVTW